VQFTLGIISIFQITIIPGFLALLIKKPKISLIEYAIIAFILSLLFNIIIGLAFLNLQIGDYIDLKTIVLVEIISIIILLVRYKTIYFTALKTKKKLDKVLLIIIYISSFYYFSLMIINFGDPISVQDTKTYINFAKSFYNSFLPDPNVTFGYPQALSILWSNSYRIIENSDLDMFIKSLHYIFPIIANLAYIELYRVKLKTYYLLGALFFNILILIYFNGYIGSGMREVEVACLVAVMYFLIIKYIATNKNEYLLLASLTGALTANIKQSGLITLVLLFLFLNYIAIKKKIGVTTYLLNLLVIIIGSFWFLYHQFLVYFGFSSSESIYLTIGIHESRNFLLRIPYAIVKFFFGSSFTILSPGIIAIGISIFILYFFSIFITKHYVTYLISALFFVHWTFYFSYDLRNLGLIFPLVSILASQTFLSLVKVDSKKEIFYSLQKINMRGICLLTLASCIPILLIGQSKYTNDNLKDISEYNQQLYDEPARTNFLLSTLQLDQSQMLATQFTGISKIESLSKYIRILPLEISKSRLEYLMFKDKIKYLYLRKTNGLSLGARDFINKLESQGRILLLSEDIDYYLYEVKFE
jgi:hypothetical protein